MPLGSENSSRDVLSPLTPTEERRRVGRYIAGGTALAVMLLAIHHVLLRGAFTIAGVCIPTIIMATYIIWVLYSARRDRRKAMRLAASMQLAEIVDSPIGSTVEIPGPISTPRYLTDGRNRHTPDLPLTHKSMHAVNHAYDHK